jgi:hypothetical protein
MHYEIDYSGMDDVTKRRKALQDCKDYLGEELFDRFTAIIATTEDTEENRTLFIHSLGMFVGIQGLPATVLVSTYIGKDLKGG